MALLRLENVSKRFGGVAALNDVSFSVEPGETFGLMGANGAGKTTLFALIGGQLRPNSGRIFFKEAALDGKRPDQICRFGISRTFQIVRPFAGISALDNAVVSALYGSQGRSPRQARDAAWTALNDVGLQMSAASLAGSLTLSGQKRLEIARALATGAELLLLDEVMAGLTPSEIEAMIETLAELKTRRKLTIVIIEHVMGALMRLSQRILVLDHGETIAQGTPEEIGANAQVLQVYFGGA